MATPDVFWAEDNDTDRELIAAALGDASRVRFFGDGHALLEALPGERPGLVVLDLDMPRLDGVRTLHAIRRDRQWDDLPVAIFSDDPTLRTSECARLGVGRVLQKPTMPDEFQRAVYAIMAT